MLEIDELTRLRFWAAYGEMKAGVSKSVACSRNGLSVFKWNDLSRLLMEHADDNKEWYAVNVVRSYVDEFLGGEVGRLAEVDLSTVAGNPEYGGCDDVLKSKLVNAIVFLIFDGLWPEMNYESIENSMFMADYVNVWSNHFSAVDGELDRYNIFDVPKELDERMQAFRKRFYSIGNIMVLPQGLRTLRRTKLFGRGYMDIFLGEFYKLMTRDKQCSYRMVDAMYLKSKDLNLFRTKDNFNGIVEGLMLDSLLDDNGVPVLTSRNFSVFDGGCSLDVYLRELTLFFDFAEKIIDERADRMMAVLMTKMNN